MRCIGHVPLSAVVLAVLSTVVLLLPHAAQAIPAMGNGRPRPGMNRGGKPRPGPAKYFHEPGGSLALSHYDARYYQGEVDYDAHRETLRHLVRSYLTTSRRLGIETWLAHGTLLGWWWNGRIMPWDYDLDVQVSMPTLELLAERYNMTMHEYVYDSDDDDDDDDDRDDDDNDDDKGTSAALSWLMGGGGGGGGGGGSKNKKKKTKAKTGPMRRQYLLDVNPHYFDRQRTDMGNVIDARWIDTATGLYIDVTGLAERDPVRQPGVWSCKNAHRYHTHDLYPLRESEFEGVPASVPFGFEHVLSAEYGVQSMVLTEWQNHRWDPDLRKWVKMNKSKKPSIETDKFLGSEDVSTDDVAQKW